MKTRTQSKPPKDTVSNPSVDELTIRLKELGVYDDVATKIREELGAKSVADLSALTEEDLRGVGMKPIPARNFLKAVGSTTTSPANGSAMLNPTAYDNVLPLAPTDEAWLKALRAGGVLKVEQSSVIAAIRAALASRVGLYGVPRTLVEKMERFADETQEQVDPEFFKLRKQLTRRAYGEIFEAVEGLDGSYVTEGRRKLLLERIDQSLWPAIFAFQEQLKTWQETYLGPGNQAMMMQQMMFALTGGGQVLPGGMIQPPDTNGLRAQAEELNNAVNQVFAGTGVQIAAALAYDAGQISETLNNPRLPAMIGAPNRDHMLRQLGVAVSAVYPRLEASLVRYVISIFQVENVPTGNEEIRYFLALHLLGSQIAWDMLGGRGNGKAVTGIGGGKL